MQIQDLKNEIVTVNRQIQELSDLKRSLQEKIAKLQNPFRSGDKVVFGANRNIGIFGGTEFRYGSARPVVYKIKKDGSVSKQKYYVWTDDVMELYDE